MQETAITALQVTPLEPKALPEFCYLIAMLDFS